MKKATSFLLAICIVFSFGAFTSFAQGSLPKTATQTIQPRAYVSDVLSYQEVLTDKYGHSTIVAQNYRRLTYVNGYETSRIQPANITTLGDILNGAERTSYTYSYRTW